MSRSKLSYACHTGTPSIDSLATNVAGKISTQLEILISELGAVNLQFAGLLTPFLAKSLQLAAPSQYHNLLTFFSVHFVPLGVSFSFAR